MGKATIKSELKKLSNKERAKTYSWFFKTGKGEYGEGDKFLGITVPMQREVAKKFLDLNLGEIKELLYSPIHEHRFTALEVLVMKFEKGRDKDKKEIADFYLKNAKLVNNWDLVDTSAPYILGKYLENKERTALYKLARSKNLWERRIAIVSTFAFIKENDLGDTFKISEILLSDKYDLIHKAVGWMLREAGKKDKKKLVAFLETHHSKMPRTTLRYSIEKFSPEERRSYLER